MADTPEFVVGCDDLQATVDWFAEKAGFRMLMLRPADDPSVSVIEGHGIRVRLDRTLERGEAEIRIPVAGMPQAPLLTAPNGTRIRFVQDRPPMTVPENRPRFVHDRADDAAFAGGRAGMQYRDLILDRQGGRYIASHISIPVGGPVPDYVHHHRIRFQMIFCHAGWADLVYEDQGEPFRFEAGDCVLQPPHIRHRVRHTSDEFEVVEIGSPAEHDTYRDHEMELPTSVFDPARDFGGQRFVWHREAASARQPWRFDGFTISDFGFAAATGGLAEVGIVRAEEGAALATHVPEHEFLFWFVRCGHATIHRNDEVHGLVARDSATLVAKETYALSDVSPDFEFLEVRIP